MILVKNNTMRPIHLNLGKDPKSKVPTMKRVTLMPGNNQVTKEAAARALTIPMVEKMVDDGELIFREAKNSDAPSAADKAKELLAASKATPTPDADNLTPAQKAAATKAAKKLAAEGAVIPPAAP